ncbi:DUF732 domain-containing protein [Mycolicibacterium llatzerense]|uniref:DUF732 domain-containing protein n=1 Tax=Mycolicibacterium llatzerense TaxID=280871 RepID=UPI000DA2151F|nr:DUF732 domain-containing protein [Mycolicibacterium llatzerense]
MISRVIVAAASATMLMLGGGVSVADLGDDQDRSMGYANQVAAYSNGLFRFSSYREAGNMAHSICDARASGQGDKSIWTHLVNSNPKLDYAVFDPVIQGAEMFFCKQYIPAGATYMSNGVWK